MRLSPVLFIAPLFIFACSATPPPVVKTVTKKPEPIIIKKDFSKILGENFRGQFSYGEGKGYFKACGTNKEFSVDITSALSNIYNRIATTPYTPVYIEFTGEITFNLSAKIDDDSVMRVDKVHHMALAKASLQCAKPVDKFIFKASGDNPYWRVNIDNGQLFFSTKASNEAYDINTSNFRATRTSRFNSIDKKGQKLTLDILPGHCYDEKNKQYWGYNTAVTSLWGRYTGCGEPGWPSAYKSFEGFYSSTNSNTTNNLVLNPDYSVEYTSTLNSSTLSDIKTIKQGFWKSNSPDRIVVMLTQEGDKNIRQEMILKRNKTLLSTAKINDNNIVSTISGGALNFEKMDAEKVVEVVSEPILITRQIIIEPEASPQFVAQNISRKFVAQNINPSVEMDPEIQKAVSNYFKIHRTDPKNTKFSSVKYDLNDNGIDDAIVLLDWCSDKSGCEMLIFDGREEGYRFSSRTSRIHAPIIISKEEYYRWQSLLVKKEAGWAALEFDGISYPMHTRDLELINKDEDSTDVILFSTGKPTQWFPVKM